MVVWRGKTYHRVVQGQPGVPGLAGSTDNNTIIELGVLINGGKAVDLEVCKGPDNEGQENKYTVSNYATQQGQRPPFQDDKLLFIP